MTRDVFESLLNMKRCCVVRKRRWRGGWTTEKSCAEVGDERREGAGARRVEVRLLKNENSFSSG
jgi:hypothetical protein